MKFFYINSIIIRPTKQYQWDLNRKQH